MHTASTVQCISTNIRRYLYVCYLSPAHCMRCLTVLHKHKHTSVIESLCYFIKQQRRIVVLHTGGCACTHTHTHTHPHTHPPTHTPTHTHTHTPTHPHTPTPTHPHPTHPPTHTYTHPHTHTPTHTHPHTHPHTHTHTHTHTPTPTPTHTHTHTHTHPTHTRTKHPVCNTNSLSDHQSVWQFLLVFDDDDIRWVLVAESSSIILDDLPCVVYVWRCVWDCALNHKFIPKTKIKCKGSYSILNSQLSVQCTYAMK